MTDVLLELTNLLRERRLGDVQAFSSAAEMQFLGNRNEITKMAKFERFDHICVISIRLNQILDISLINYEFRRSRKLLCPTNPAPPFRLLPTLLRAQPIQSGGPARMICPAPSRW